MNSGRAEQKVNDSDWSSVCVQPHIKMQIHTLVLDFPHWPKWAHVYTHSVQKIKEPLFCQGLHPDHPESSAGWPFSSFVLLICGSPLRIGVKVEADGGFSAAAAALTGKEESPGGRAPALTPQGLSGSRTISSLAPLDINECTTVCLATCAFLSKRMKATQNMKTLIKWTWQPFCKKCFRWTRSSSLMCEQHLQRCEPCTSAQSRMSCLRFFLTTGLISWTELELRPSCHMIWKNDWHTTVHTNVYE